MKLIILILSLIVGFFFSADFLYRLFSIWGPWENDFMFVLSTSPWGGKEVFGFTLTLIIFFVSLLPTLAAQAHKICAINKPLLVGGLGGLMGYPFTLAVFVFLSDFFKLFSLGSWFWPMGLILTTALIISISYWVFIDFYVKTSKD